MFPIMTDADKMHLQSNTRHIKSFWREIWITTQPQQPSSHFKEHIHPPKHYEHAGKGSRIPWIVINVVEAKCSGAISLYGHADLLEQSTTMQKNPGESKIQPTGQTQPLEESSLACRMTVRGKKTDKLFNLLNLISSAVGDSMITA